VEAAAVKNPDGSVVVELLNRGEMDARYAFRVNGHIVRFEVPRDTLSAILLTADELT
jgi:glucosylceramidase